MIIPWLVVVGLAGASGYIVARSRQAVREAAVRKQLREGTMKALMGGAGSNGLVPTPLPQEAYRAPDPAAVINTPTDAEDFGQMKEAFCVCYQALVEDEGKPPSQERLCDCFLGAIYPDFAWPPVPGDPAAAQLMWLIANHEARKLLTEPTPCTPPIHLEQREGPS
jgi:hypothetical protein